MLAMNSWCRTLAAGVVSALALSIAGASAAPWPQRTVHVIVPVGAGSGTDIAARVFAERLAVRWKQPVVIENRPGADGMIGTETFAATRDDHTLLFSFTAPVSLFPVIQEKLPYDPRDVVPIASAADTFLSVTATASANISSLTELVARARTQPGKLNYNAAAGALPYLFANFVKSENLDMVLVPYRELNLALADLTQGRLHVMLSTMTTVLPAVDAGKVRILALTNKVRAPIKPEIPTATEAGFAELAFEGLAGFFGPRDLPAEVRDRIAADVRAVAADPAVANRLVALGQVAHGSTPTEFAASIEEQRGKMVTMARLVGSLRPAQ